MDDVKSLTQGKYPWGIIINSRFVKIVSSSPVILTIYVVRKSYNNEKAQDIVYLVLFHYYILCFCHLK